MHMPRLWKNLRWLCLLTCLPLLGEAQAPRRWTAADIHHAIKKANVLGSALYVAAHPDDENTRMIAWLANELKVEVAYLSITRGDGGQNLIGPEIAELLGVLRTQELLAARRIDGGAQRFTRANDFGYSKSPEETLRLWNKDEVLSDVVWIIRSWRPDVVINRFDHSGQRPTHGHHTASAMLSVEAFDLAGRTDAFPEQLQYVAPHQPARLFFNTSWWFYGSREAFEKADKSNMIVVDVGTYYPLLGKSNNEIAAESRSQHKCQGFGSSTRRGSQMEYLQLLKGDTPPARDNPFAGIELSWRRLPGGEPIARLLETIDRTFRPDQPWRSVPQLQTALQMIERLPENHWTRIKSEEIREIIAACMGLFLDLRTSTASATPGETIPIQLEVINRSPVRAQLKAVRIRPAGPHFEVQIPLPENRTWIHDTTLHLSSELPFTSPYWLTEPWQLGMYTVEAQHLRGLPETPQPIQVEFELEIEGTPLVLVRQLKHHYTDQVEGEVYEPFQITPPLFANFDQDVYVFSEGRSKEVAVIVRAARDSLSGTLRLSLPEGWLASPTHFELALPQKGQSQRFTFQLTPPDTQSVGRAVPLVEVEGQTWSHKVVYIDYDHIPKQTVVLPSSARLARIDIKKAGQRIAYIMGAGDKVPESLRQIGYQVDLVEVDAIDAAHLAHYDAVVLGVRVCNTHEQLRYKLAELWRYARNGGTVVMQYQTTWGLKVPMDELAPYPLKLSRQRVTVEDAPVTFLAPDHPVLNHPNRITRADFEGWVQERGLYFAGEWDDAYTPVLASNDPGEPLRKGGLLVARLGKGWFVYTGFSWFRQLPAGVPGAYRLFANIISLGQQP